MEAYSSSSASSSSYMQDNNHNNNYRDSNNKVPYYTSSLHSVRKAGAPAKPWKKPVAPLPPTPPRVYKVDPINFRDLVQRLTAAPEFQLESSSSASSSSRLQTMAPPPVQAVPPPPGGLLHRPLPEKASSLSTVYKEFSEVLESNNKPAAHQNNNINNVVGSSFLGLMNSSSPISTSHNWCSFPLLSPGTLSSLEQSRVL
ncbi:VQ motif containing protein [Trema orientale]|uniref:VQ motif containing protein n=1 Tax=Trema orientale TaxID=63057 RepID=A0A2P5FSD0_TREOI|nr:VQ motif containing protein [Trema orientale]